MDTKIAECQKLQIKLRNKEILRIAEEVSGDNFFDDLEVE